MKPLIAFTTFLTVMSYLAFPDLPVLYKLANFIVWPALSIFFYLAHHSEFVLKFVVKPFIWGMTMLGLSVWLFGFWLTPYEGHGIILSAISLAGAVILPIGMGLVFMEFGLVIWRRWK